VFLLPTMVLMIQLNMEKLGTVNQPSNRGKVHRNSESPPAAEFGRFRQEPSRHRPLLA
jgi:hypothetical protein